MKLFRSKYKKIISILVASSMLLGNYHPYVRADEPVTADGDGAVVLGEGDGVPVNDGDVPDEPATGEEVPDAGVDGDGTAVLGDGDSVPVAEEGVPIAEDYAPVAEDDAPIAEDDAPENLTADDIRDAKITVSGYKEVDGKRYVKDHLTFHAPEGFYTSYNIGGAEDFAESYYDDGDIIIMYFDDGSAVNSDLEFKLKIKQMMQNQIGYTYIIIWKASLQIIRHLWLMIHLLMMNPISMERNLASKMEKKQYVKAQKRLYMMKTFILLQ